MGAEPLCAVERPDPPAEPHHLAGQARRRDLPATQLVQPRDHVGVPLDQLLGRPQQRRDHRRVGGQARRRGEGAELVGERHQRGRHPAGLVGRQVVDLGQPLVRRVGRGVGERRVRSLRRRVQRPLGQADLVTAGHRRGPPQRYPCRGRRPAFDRLGNRGDGRHRRGAGHAAPGAAGSGSPSRATLAWWTPGTSAALAGTATGAGTMPCRAPVAAITRSGQAGRRPVTAVIRRRLLPTEAVDRARASPRRPIAQAHRRAMDRPAAVRRRRVGRARRERVTHRRTARTRWVPASPRRTARTRWVPASPRRTAQTRRVPASPRRGARASPAPASPPRAARACRVPEGEVEAAAPGEGRRRMTARGAWAGRRIRAGARPSGEQQAQERVG